MKTFIFTCFISLLLCAGVAQAQQKTDSASAKKPSAVKTDSATVHLKNDTLKIHQTYPAGLRIGIDISRFAMMFFQPYRTDVNFTADARINKDLYAVADFGVNRTKHSDTNYTYKGGGAFIALGVDYNLLKKQSIHENNMFFVGARYGVAMFNYEFPTYTIYDNYYGNVTGSVPKTNEMAHWLEFAVGLRTEVLKNFYMGWSLRVRTLLNSKIIDGDYAPLVIPGYGAGDKKAVFDFNYTLSYLIPLYKLKAPSAPIAVPKKKK
ncbi:hypothetical protein LX64_00259 [Chitinophaga skermanii]|uniref:Outer membrane protein with beta-barrel domain n=1 Tax=Chitinophaga skermanii TaxID=331697 RepID=A0A327R4G1_9BACT|nr:DUF6048 family protein [Chitinophaga skermanii]RAJ10654.1 hypothetical protein LX64_00259 [Chitinophaga skermanii]